MIAHQRKIRDQLAATEGDPIGINLSLAAATVRPIGYKEAAAVILKYEWLGTMPVVPLYQFGIFFGDVIGGVVVFAPEPTENLGVWDRYGYTGRIIMLARGACAHWTPTNTASRLIAAAVRQLPERFEVITATVDACAGEIGTIYQACNFDYVGHMRKRPRPSQPRRALATPTPRKARYFLFRGKDRVRLRAAVAHLLKPYPKRDDAPTPIVRVARSAWHPTGKQKRKAIADRLRRDPGRSDRGIGLEVGADGKTVAAVRAELIRRAEIPHVMHRVDTIGRRVGAIAAAIVLALIPIAAHAESSIVQFHGGITTPAQEFNSPEWRAMIRANQENEFRAWCADNPEACRQLRERDR